MAFSLKEGEISDPVWVNEGAYILRLLKRTDESFQTFEAVKRGHSQADIRAEERKY